MLRSGSGTLSTFVTRRLDVVVRKRVRRITPSILTTKIVRVGNIARAPILNSCKEGPNLFEITHVAVELVLTAADCI